MRHMLLCLAAGLALAAALAAPGRAAETVKVGTVKGPIVGPLFLAQERGYFAAEGLAVEIVYFDAAQPIAVATASGDIEFGAVGLTGGFYALAGQGSLRIIGGAFSESPGFRLIAYVASNRAWDAGLKSVADFRGHAVAVTQIGSSLHYALGLAAEKYGVELKSIRVLPLQANANIASAVKGGQTDAALLNAFISEPIAGRGEAHILGWVGDTTPWQMGGIFTATKTADERRATVAHFLAGYRKGARDYFQAFAGADGKRQDGATSGAVEALIAARLGETPAQVAASLAYIDPELRVDTKDIRHQIAWYGAEGMIKGKVDGAALLDRRYVRPLAAKQ